MGNERKGLASATQAGSADGRPEWWRDCGKIAELLRWLDHDEGIDLSTAIEIVSTPWSWTDEYDRMCFDRDVAAGRADPPSDGRITIDEDRPEFQEECE